MTEIDQRYLVQQRKINPDEKDVPVFAKAMRSKTGVFEGMYFIRNKEKASVMTLEQAQEVIDWIKLKKTQTSLYLTSIICKGQ